LWNSIQLLENTKKGEKKGKKVLTNGVIVGIICKLLQERLRSPKKLKKEFEKSS